MMPRERSRFNHATRPVPCARLRPLRALVRACVRAHVCVRAHACVRVRVRACVRVHVHMCLLTPRACTHAPRACTCTAPTAPPTDPPTRPPTHSLTHSDSLTSGSPSSLGRVLWHDVDLQPLHPAAFTSHLPPPTSHLSPLTSHLPPPTSYLSPLASRLSPLNLTCNLTFTLTPTSTRRAGLATPRICQAAGGCCGAAGAGVYMSA